MLKPLFRRAGKFARDAGGVSAIEFAFIAPLAIAFVLGAFDTYRYIYTTQRLQLIANSVAQMYAATPKDNPTALTSPGTITDDWINLFYNSLWLVYPDFLGSSFGYMGGDWTNNEVDVAIVDMIPSGTTYKPKTAWTTYLDIYPHARPCTDAYQIIANDAPPATEALPQGVIGPSQVIVVDARVPYHSLFTSGLFAPTNLIRTAYSTPRYVSQLKYKNDGWKQGTICP